MPCASFQNELPAAAAGRELLDVVDRERDLAGVDARVDPGERHVAHREHLVRQRLVALHDEVEGEDQVRARDAELARGDGRPASMLRAARLDARDRRRAPVAERRERRLCRERLRRRRR